MGREGNEFILSSREKNTQRHRRLLDLSFNLKLMQHVFTYMHWQLFSFQW